MKRALLTTLSLLLGLILHAQCPIGAVGVSGPGCGCLSGCNLTAFGGPNCSPSVGGNCTAGQVPYQFDILVPAGCTFAVTATMANRPSCTSSGADSGDQMKVDIVGGVKPFITGASNASITDNFTLAGPGSIRISGTANRADEIVTYSTIDAGGTCPSCGIFPVEWLSLNADVMPSTVQINWTTAQESNSDFFVVERANGEQNALGEFEFEPISKIAGAGNSDVPRNYTIVDSDPISGASIYRIKQVDLDGSFKYSALIEVEYSEKLYVESVFPNPSTGRFHIEIGGNSESPIEIIVLNTLGEIVFKQAYSSSQSLELDLHDQAKGIYLLQVSGSQYSYSQKLIVQ